jgi:hypothetical protein
VVGEWFKLDRSNPRCVPVGPLLDFAKGGPLALWVRLPFSGRSATAVTRLPLHRYIHTDVERPHCALKRSGNAGPLASAVRNDQLGHPLPSTSRRADGPRRGRSRSAKRPNAPLARAVSLIDRMNHSEKPKIGSTGSTKPARLLVALSSAVLLFVNHAVIVHSLQSGRNRTKVGVKYVISGICGAN